MDSGQLGGSGSGRGSPQRPRSGRWTMDRCDEQQNPLIAKPHAATPSLAISGTDEAQHSVTGTLILANDSRSSLSSQTQTTAMGRVDMGQNTRAHPRARESDGVGFLAPSKPYRRGSQDNVNIGLSKQTSGTTLAPARTSAVFGSCPDLPGVVQETSRKPPNERPPSRQNKPPPRVRLLPIAQTVGLAGLGIGAEILPEMSCSFPALLQRDESIPRTAPPRNPLPPIRSPAELRPSSSNFTGGRRNSLSSALLSRSMTAVRDQPSSPQPLRPSALARSCEANLGQVPASSSAKTLSHHPSGVDSPVDPRCSTALASHGPPDDMNSLQASVPGGHCQKDRGASVDSDDAFAATEAPVNPSLASPIDDRAPNERLLRPWLAGAGAFGFLRPLRASDLRKALLRQGGTRRVRHNATADSSHDQVDSAAAAAAADVPTETDAGAPKPDTSDLDLYLPERKIGVFVGTWNMMGEKVPETVLEFLLPPSVEELQDLIVLGSQESPSARKAWEIKLQETLGPSHILLRTVALGTLYLVVFIRKELLWFVTDVEDDSFSTRPGSRIKTKGAVALSLKVFGTSFLFVTSHLTAHQANVQDRHNDVSRISAALRLSDDKDDSQMDSTPIVDRFDCVFWCGDLNYRCDTPYDHAVKLVQSHNLKELRKHDQLIKAMNTGEVFDGFEEMMITFPPTFKFDQGSDIYDTSAKQRTPSWTDRILYASRPSTTSNGLLYGSCRDVYFSDHKPVYGVFRVSVEPPTGDAVIVGSCPSMGIFNQSVYVEGNSRRLARMTLPGPGRAGADSAVCAVL